MIEFLLSHPFVGSYVSTDTVQWSWPLGYTTQLWHIAYRQKWNPFLISSVKPHNVKKIKVLTCCLASTGCFPRSRRSTPAHSKLFWAINLIQCSHLQGRSCHWMILLPQTIATTTFLAEKLYTEVAIVSNSDLDSTQLTHFILVFHTQSTSF